MGAQLNIKSEDAYRLASRLAELTGESLTSVVTKALRAELEREERARDREERLRRVREITADIRAPSATTRCRPRITTGCTTRTGCRGDRR